MGVSLLSPLRPVLCNGEPLIELLGNALTFERVLQCRAPGHRGQPTGQECATQLVSNCRGARLMGVRWSLIVGHQRQLNAMSSRFLVDMCLSTWLFF